MKHRSTTTFSHMPARHKRALRAFLTQPSLTTYTAKPAYFWEFWLPQSGFVGGLIVCGAIVAVLFLFLFLFGVLP